MYIKRVDQGSIILNTAYMASLSSSDGNWFRPSAVTEQTSAMYTSYMITDPHPTNSQTGTQYAFHPCFFAILCMYSRKSYETT